jgi:hypothetical protein
MTRAEQRQAWRAFLKLVGRKNKCTFAEFPTEEARYYAVTRMGVKYVNDR